MTSETGYPSFLKPAAPAAEAASQPVGKQPWIVVIADDEPDVHTVTQFALDGFQFEGRPLRLMHAHSGRETVELLRNMPDVALLLLDVVMESEHAGLEAVKSIRGELGNQRVRIVLRTGQPGAAPEADVISQYDINGYADKTELTKRKLQTILYSCLRSFRDIQTIECQLRVINANRRGLERVIDATATIFQISSFERFTEGVLEQLSVLATPYEGDCMSSGLYARVSGVAATNSQGDFRIIAGTGPYEGAVGQHLVSAVTPEVHERIMRCLTEKRSAIGADDYIGVFASDFGAAKVVYISGCASTAINDHMIELFSRNVGIAFDNIELRTVIEETQREIVYRLGGAVETRSKETANHVRRVAQISRLLGLRHGMSEKEAEVFYLASPLHDLGKIGIPDHILNKPGKLTPEEWEVMKTHPIIGYNLLKDSAMEILRVGAQISLDHHEKWDGSGYPYGKSGAEISIHGRITAVVDVFDALGSRRCYKEAWPLADVTQHIADNAGSHFDPEIVELLFANLDDVTAISRAFPD
ncbi:MAG TPA: DUF3369 domain-containing protein [Stellaceae bacterium]|nr:DUF3369 domain-containing protein [Stellaceae bacterium]